MADQTDMRAAIERFQARPPARRLVMELAGKPWAIRREVLPSLYAIAMRESLGPEAIGVELGRPLEGSRSMTVRDGTAILPIIGPIIPRAGMLGDVSGVASVSSITRDLRAALADEEVTSILLEVDSPGGVVTGLSDLAREIRAADAIKPVTAYVAGTGASAAYWLASAAGELVVEDTAALGCIGAVIGYPVQEAPDRDGYRTLDIVSSGAPDKRPDVTTDGGRAVVVAELDAIEAIFVDQVAAHRGVPADTVRSDFGRGGVLVGAAAVSAGMADRVANFEEAVRVAAARAMDGNGAEFAARPVSNGSADMDLSAITLDQLRADRPDLVENIATDATAAANAGVDGKIEAARAEERARVTGILDLAGVMPAAETVAASSIASGASVEATAVAILKADGDRRSAALRAKAADDPKVGTNPAALDEEIEEEEDPVEGEASDPVEAEARAKWNKDKALRAEFGTFEAFLGYHRAAASGRVRGA